MDDFDRDIHAAFHGRQLPGAPDGLLRTLDELPHRQARPMLGSFRLALGMAAVLIVLLVAAVALGGGSPTVPPVVSPSPSQAAIIGPTASPAESSGPSPSTAPSEAPSPSEVPTSRPTATPTPAANSGPAGLLDPEHGWAVGDQRLLVTSDGGASWQDVNPPAPTQGGVAANLLGVQFLDPGHGWVAFAEPFKLTTDPSFGRIDVWRTTDGGLTWARSELPRAKINNAGDTIGPFSFDFLDPTHGFAFISGNYTHVTADSDLYWTADGGMTWSADRPTGPGYTGVEGSSISFATANDGVVVGTPGGSGISVTHDGGKTWANAAVSLLSSTDGDIHFFSQPIFFDARTGLVAARLQSAQDSITRIFRTTDGGSSWTYIRRLPGSGPLIIAIVDEQQWIATDGSDAVHTQNGGTSWTELLTGPPLSGLQATSFVDLKDGWAQWTDKQGISHVDSTSDGGVSWRALAP